MEGQFIYDFAIDTIDIFSEAYAEAVLSNIVINTSAGDIVFAGEHTADFCSRYGKGSVSFDYECPGFIS